MGQQQQQGDQQGLETTQRMCLEKWVESGLLIGWYEGRRKSQLQLQDVWLEHLDGPGGPY